MKFKANKTIILWHDGQMKVFNPTDPEPGDLPEDIISPYIISGEASEPDADEDETLADDSDAIAAIIAEPTEPAAEPEAAPADAEPAPVEDAAPVAPAKPKK
jgi:hypothetical protein